MRMQGTVIQVLFTILVLRAGADGSEEGIVLSNQLDENQAAVGIQFETVSQISQPGLSKHQTWLHSHKYLMPDKLVELRRDCVDQAEYDPAVSNCTYNYMDDYTLVRMENSRKKSEEFREEYFELNHNFTLYYISMTPFYVNDNPTLCTFKDIRPRFYVGLHLYYSEDGTQQSHILGNEESPLMASYYRQFVDRSLMYTASDFRGKKELYACLVGIATQDFDPKDLSSLNNYCKIECGISLDRDEL